MDIINPNTLPVTKKTVEMLHLTAEVLAKDTKILCPWTSWQSIFREAWKTASEQREHKMKRKQ
jgi:hypothetical protein